MKNSILLCLLIFLFASCDKKESTDTPTPPAPPISPTTNSSFSQFSVTEEKFEQSAKILKREVAFLNNKPAMKYVRMFSYDANNRCQQLQIGTIDSSLNSPQFNLTQTISFKYDGASLLPASLSSVRTVFPNLVTTFYYKYNSGGLKVMDSVRVKNLAGEPADRTVRYIYEGFRVYTTPVFTGFSTDNNPFDTLDLLKAGNIEKLISKSTSSGAERIVIYNFTYDQFINPYNKLNIANSLYFENAGIGLGYNVPLETHYLGVTINNLTSWSSGSYTANFKYAYDKDKYPVKKEMTLPGDPNPYQVIYFEY